MGIRTPDLRITSAPLFQLSYAGPQVIIIRDKRNLVEGEERSLRSR